MVGLSLAGCGHGVARRAGVRAGRPSSFAHDRLTATCGRYEGRNISTSVDQRSGSGVALPNAETPHLLDETPFTAEHGQLRVDAGLKAQVPCPALAQNCTAQHSQACHEKRSEEHTSELQSLMRISYAVFCLKKKKQ